MSQVTRSNPKGTGFRSLVVWQRGVLLAREVYVLTAKLPKQEDYGISAQMQRAAVSVPSNLAEGSKRGTQKEFAQFIRIALGSAAELETQIEITKSIYQNVRTSEVEKLLGEVSAMLVNLLKKVQK